MSNTDSQGVSSPVITPGTLIPQKHGGALLHGNPGNRGAHVGQGRAASLIRDSYKEAFAERLPVLCDIADGRPMETVRLELGVLAALLECPSCHQGYRPTDPDKRTLELTVQRSASPKDRITALDVIGKYGLGALKEISTEHVRAKLAETLDVIRKHVDTDTAARILGELRPIWTG